MIDHLRTPHGLLAAEVVTTYHVDWLTYSHVRQAGKLGLEDIFKLAYGKEMEMMDSPNDTDYSWEIKKGELGAYDAGKVARHIENGHFESYHLRILMVDLCNKNVLPAGHYVVTVSW